MFRARPGSFSICNQISSSSSQAINTSFMYSVVYSSYKITVNDRNGNFTETQKQKPALENNRYSVSVSVSAESTSFCRNSLFLQKELVSAKLRN